MEKTRCQECSALEAEYNPESMSAALCPECIIDRISETVAVYDYPNEREG